MPAEGGDDILVGGVGDDLLVGGAGQNLLVGGFAANRPANTGQDVGLSALDALMVRGWSGKGDSSVMPDVPTDALPLRFADESFLLNGGGAERTMPADQGASQATFAQDAGVSDVSWPPRW
jgi:hypothetical protein